jgi:hypothetical protein
MTKGIRWAWRYAIRNGLRPSVKPLRASKDRGSADDKQQQADDADLQGQIVGVVHGPLPKPSHLYVLRHRGVLETQAFPATLIASSTRRRSRSQGELPRRSVPERRGGPLPSFPVSILFSLCISLSLGFRTRV